MPLYKLFCIAAHYPEYAQIKSLVQSSAKFLLDQGSVVREIRFLGLNNLPQEMRRHNRRHAIGDYWLMNFDASPRTLALLNDRMRTDHRVIRWTMLKLGENLTDIVDTRQASVRYDNSLLHISNNDQWSLGGTGIPKSFAGPAFISEALPGSVAGKMVGTDRRVAGLAGDSANKFDDAVASLGGTQYSRLRM